MGVARFVNATDTGTASAKIGTVLAAFANDDTVNGTVAKEGFVT